MRRLNKKILVFAVLVFSLITNAKNDTLHSQNKIKFRIGAGVLTNIGQIKNFHYEVVTHKDDFPFPIKEDYNITPKFVISPLLFFAFSKKIFSSKNFFYAFEVGENIFYSHESYNGKGTKEFIGTNLKYDVEKKVDNYFLNNTTFMNFSTNWIKKYTYSALLGIGWNNIIYYKYRYDKKEGEQKCSCIQYGLENINFNPIFNLGFDFSYRIGKLNISNRILFSPQLYKNQFISSLYYNFPKYNYHTFFITIINL